MGFDNECILNIQSVSGEYFCPVCRTLVYPNEALQTPCTHLYCKPCLVHIASSNQACPCDGYLVTEAGSKPLVETNKNLAETIGKIAVRCLYHRSGCMWQGPLSECTTHHSECAFGDSPMICNKCGVQIPHRQVEEHAQICNVNVMGPQPQQGPQNVQDAATSGVALSVDQSKPAIQAGVPTSQPQASQTAPAQNLNQPTIANPQPQALPAIVMSTSGQWYQLQYQQYYQQYPVCDAYQQVYQQMFPFSLQATQQFHQPTLQVPGQAQSQAHAQLRSQSQVLLQQQIQPPVHVELQQQVQPPTQAQLHPPTQAQGQPQNQSQLQAQPQISFHGQSQPHLYPQAAMTAPNQNLPQLYLQQQIQPSDLAHVQIQTQNQPLTHGHMLQLYLQGQPHAVQGNAQHHMEVPQFQQPPLQMHHSQPSHVHPYPQSQLQPHPQGYPQFQPHPQLQPPHMQHPPVHSVAGHQAYTSQPHQQILQAPPQQLPMQVHPLTGSVPLGQVPPQFPQPPTYMRPLLPLQPPQKLPSQGQAPWIPPTQHHIHPHSQQGLLVHPQPVMHQFQQPMPRQYALLPQVFAGYASGPLQGQLHHAGPFAQQHSPVCPQGPPQLMQQPPLGYVQPQQGTSLAHDMQPHSSQSYMGRPAFLNQVCQLYQLPQSSSAAGIAPHSRPPQFGSNQHYVNQSNVNMINQLHALSDHQLIQSEPSLGGGVERRADQTSERRTKQQENKPPSVKNCDMDANGSGANLNEAKPGTDMTNEHIPENGGEDHCRQDEAVTKDAVTEMQKLKGVSCHPVTTQRLKEDGKKRALDHSPGGKMVQNKAVDVRHVPLYSVKQGEVNMNMQPPPHLRPPGHGHLPHPGQVPNLAEHFHPLGPNQPGSFYPEYQLGGPPAPGFEPMLAWGPNNFANHTRTFELQYAGLQTQYSQGQVPPYGEIEPKTTRMDGDVPPGFNSSAPVFFYEQFRIPIGKHPDAFPVGPSRRLDQGFPHQQHLFGDPFGAKSTHPHLGEPGFQSSYTSNGVFYEGGSASFDSSAKRKSLSGGWCRICKVDCGSVEGLEMHGQTQEHQRKAMDMVTNIKQKAARIAETSSARSGPDEANKLGNAGSHGCGNKP